MVALVAAGVACFGSVYPWAYGPLAAAAVVLSAWAWSTLAWDRFVTADERPLAVALALFCGAAALQLLPLHLRVISEWSPRTIEALRQLNPQVAMGITDRHPVSIDPRLSRVGLGLFGAFGLLLFGSAAVATGTGARPLAKRIAGLGVVVAVAGIVQQSITDGTTIYGFWRPLEGGTGYGPFVNRNHFAGWMLMCIPLTLGLVCGNVARATRRQHRGARDWLYWLGSSEANELLLLSGGALVMALALMLTLSRSGIAALAAAIAITTAAVQFRSTTRAQTVFMTVYLLIFVSTALVWAGADPVVARFSSSGWSQLDNRREVWSDAARIARAFPLAGTGLNTYGVASTLFHVGDPAIYYREAHSDYLQLAAEGGWLLTAPALGAVLAFAAVVRRRFRAETGTGSYWLRVGAVTGIVAIALQETVEFSLQMPGNAVLFAVLCGIALHRTPGTRT